MRVTKALGDCCGDCGSQSQSTHVVFPHAVSLQCVVLTHTPWPSSDETTVPCFGALPKCSSLPHCLRHLELSFPKFDGVTWNFFGVADSSGQVCVGPEIHRFLTNLLVTHISSDDVFED